MKKNGFILIALLALICQPAFTQKKIDIGVQGGYNYAMPKLKSSRLYGNLNGFHAGPVLTYNIKEQIGVQTGILYNYYNTVVSKITVGTSGTWKQNRIIGQGIDIPLRAIYSLPLADDLIVQFGAGPNFNYALSKLQQKENYVDSKIVSSLTDKGTSIYASPSDFNRLDTQLGLSLGIKYTGISLKASYDLGFFDRDKTSSGSYRENNIKISLGYTF